MAQNIGLSPKISENSTPPECEEIMKPGSIEIHPKLIILTLNYFLKSNLFFSDLVFFSFDLRK